MFRNGKIGPPWTGFLEFFKRTSAESLGKPDSRQRLNRGVAGAGHLRTANSYLADIKRRDRSVFGPSRNDHLAFGMQHGPQQVR